MSTLADRFLHEAGLPPDATRSDIRKAYACALKRIDQASEPQAFQQLRAAYEAALNPSAEQPVLLPAAEPLASPAVPSGQEMAADVLAWLPAARWARHDDVERLLMAALADTRLLTLQARQDFEAALAARLAEGWRSGHEHLFSAATEVFGWDLDPGRLAGLGAAGALLDTALQQMQALHSLPIAQRSAVGAIVRALRSDKPPAAAFLAHRLAEAEACCAAYLCWLQIVTRPANLARWQAQARRMPGWQRTGWALLTCSPQGGAQTGGVDGADTALLRQGGRLALAALIGICLLTRLLPADPPSKPAPVVEPASNFQSEADTALPNPLPPLRQTTRGHTRPAKIRPAI